ncbi:cell wall hydrolase [Pseudobutyrivibrio ruminis]|uniref:cell wall hydrolase n=1 Tax=Pseudobutyrivibrio ruminis TaxID=46206 RepID=UPI000425ACA8|nr:cell wall hydrolase [Pseudobutyrivibrio ruminis]
MKRFKGCLAIVLIAVLCLSSSAQASQSEVDRLKEESQKASDAVKDINNQKQQVEGAKQQLEGQANSLTGQISSLNNQISSVTGEISETEADIAEVEADIETLNEQLERTQASLDAQRKSMKLRIQYMYENRSTNTLINFLESGSISEFLQRLEYMAQITAYDQAAVERFAATQKEIEDTKSAIEEKGQQLSAYQDNLKSKKSQLGVLVSDTSTALNVTNSQIADTKAAIAELEKQLDDAKAYEKRIQKQYQDAQVALAEKLAGEHGGYSGGYTTTDEETLILAALIQAEAANQGDAGRLAVGSVVMNRVASSKFPNTVSGVVYASGQFAPVTSGRVALILAEGPNSACQYAAAQAIAGNTNTDALFFCTYTYAQALHDSQVAAGQSGFLDRTSGTTINAHYFYNYL